VFHSPVILDIIPAIYVLILTILVFLRVISEINPSLRI